MDYLNPVLSNYYASKGQGDDRTAISDKNRCQTLIRLKKSLQKEEEMMYIIISGQANIVTHQLSSRKNLQDLRYVWYPARCPVRHRLVIIHNYSNGRWYMLFTPHTSLWDALRCFGVCMKRWKCQHHYFSQITYYFPCYGIEKGTWGGSKESGVSCGWLCPLRVTYNPIHVANNHITERAQMNIE